MHKTQFTFWQDEEFYIGFLNDYPDYETQALSKDELMDNLKDLLLDLTSGAVPFVRHVEELMVA